MIKKIIPAAVLLSLFGAAQAQVAVYGLVDLSYGKSLSEAAMGKIASFHSGGDGDQGNSTTRVGLKGSTLLAKGLKANFQLETNGIKTDLTLNTPYFDRAAWVGVSNHLGEVRFGKQDSVAFQTMVGLDSNGSANMASAQGNAGVATWGTARQTLSLQYMAPEVQGFKAQIGLALKDDDRKENNKVNYAFGVTYTAGPLSAAVTAESARFDAGTGFTAVAGSYDFKTYKLMAGYANGGVNAKGVTVGVVAPVAGYNVGLNYSKNSDVSSSATELFVNREVYKNTYGYADIANVDAKSGKSNAYAVGMIYSF